MERKNGLIFPKVFIEGFLSSLFVALAVILFSSGSLKAADQGEPPKSGSQSSTAVLATSDGETPGTRVEVTELRRTSGGTLTLRFAMINDSDKKLDFGYNFVEESNHIKDFNSVGGIHLIDPVGKKKYFVIRDTEGACVCSRNLKDINPGSRANLYAKFPAPPEGVQKITIEIPHFIPMEDVPISQ
jgi:hypothetical protein